MAGAFCLSGWTTASSRSGRKADGEGTQTFGPSQCSETKKDPEPHIHKQDTEFSLK